MTIKSRTARLQQAVMAGDAEATVRALACGAPPSHVWRGPGRRAEVGRSALAWAVLLDHREVVEALLRGGAQVRQVNARGEHVLHTLSRQMTAKTPLDLFFLVASSDPDALHTPSPRDDKSALQRLHTIRPADRLPERMEELLLQQLPPAQAAPRPRVRL